MLKHLSRKKLWRIPQQGKIKGVCAGIARYFDVPVKLVRLIVILACFFGFAFIVIVAYLALSYFLDPMPDDASGMTEAVSPSDLLRQVDSQLAEGEKKLRAMERYVTSDSYALQGRFKKL